MFYREAGQFKRSYAEDQAVFPILQERYFVLALAVFAFCAVPFMLNDFWTKTILIPFLCYTLAALGLNILTGYCGLLSLGTGAFMAVGAVASYKLMVDFPGLNIVFVLLISGFITAIVGILFGLPSLRIKGFYLAVATLAAQFFIIWLFNKYPWFLNNNSTGHIEALDREIFGYVVTGAKADLAAKYLFTLSIVSLMTIVAINLTRGSIGRSWMAIRDMDIAAELIGIRPLITKLSAFAISSFFIGITGGLFLTVYLGSVDPGEAFGIQESFNVLFIIIIGGLGSVLGAFLGAAFWVALPIGLEALLVDSLGMSTAFAEHIKFILLGSLILFFLIVEPHGLARLWQIVKEKLRLWPFPH